MDIVTLTNEGSDYVSIVSFNQREHQRMLISPLYVVATALLFLPSGCQSQEELPFLKGLSEKAKKEYDKIETDHKITQRQRKYKLLSWADKYGVKKQVQDFHRQEEKAGEELDKKVENYLKTHADNTVFHLYEEYLALNDKFKTDEEIEKEDKEFWKNHEKELMIIEAAYNRFDPQNETATTVQRNPTKL